MSITGYAMGLEDAARYAVTTAKAVNYCGRHDVLIRRGDDDAERHAYALATTILKRKGEFWKIDDLKPAIRDELDMAADGECPECAYERDH